MGLPRVRFTVGTLILAIAVLAVDCWLLRRFCEVPVYEAGPVSYRILPADVGVLPLLDVSLFGVLPCVARCIRALAVRGARKPRSILSGPTYFSLQLLILVGLIRLYTPEAYDLPRELLGSVTDWTARDWAAILGEPGDRVAWLLFEGLLLGFLVSGPLLLLSWLGHLTATRCAETLPRFRFQAMAFLVSLGFASADLAVCITPQPFEEELEVGLEIRVTDEDSGRTIPGAFVRMTDPFSYEPSAMPPSAFTSSDGIVRFTGRFPTRGERNTFQIMASFSPWGRWLEVSAEGHRTQRLPLVDLLGPFADPLRPGPCQVALGRGKTPAGSFHNLSGTYLSGGYGFGGRLLQIEPDGRFAWRASDCMDDYREFGYLKRHDQEIEFVPIPHPGRDIHPLMTCKYRAIRWGERLYLCLADYRELREFCRMALTPHRPSRSNDAYGSYLRQQDRDKPQTGLPRLPATVWLGFLAESF